MASPFPKKFKMLTIPYYDRTVYPSEHLGKFTLWMRLYGVHEHIMYRAFDSILSSNSERLFKRISKESIISWDDLRWSILTNFVGAKGSMKNTVLLVQVRQY